MKNSRKAVFLDRDGTILKDMHYLANPDHIAIYRGVIPALRRLRENGWRLIIGTNQSGIGRGYFTVETLHVIHDRLLEIFRKSKLEIDEILFCPHHPEAGCRCRKPEVGMLLKAKKKFGLDLKRCVVIGDKVGDVLWGKKGGARTILVLTGKGKKHRRKLKAQPDKVARSLVTAADWILDNEAHWN